MRLNIVAFSKIYRFSSIGEDDLLEKLKNPKLRIPSWDGASCIIRRNLGQIKAKGFDVREATETIRFAIQSLKLNI